MNEGASEFKTASRPAQGWPVRMEMNKVMVLPDWDAYEAAVDDAIATSDGDLRGALTALIIVNEHLERDLQAALAVAAAPSIAELMG